MQLTTGEIATPFPIVVGSGRSGTTLLRMMLNAHPEMAVPRESHFLIDLLADRRSLEISGGLELPHLFRVLRNNRWLSAWHLDLASAEAEMIAAAPRDLASAVRFLYSLYAKAHGKPRYGDKTPSYVMHIADIALLLPETRFVHLIRDGRDVALSFLAAGFGPTSVEEAALHWRQRVSRGCAAGRALGPSRYLEIRYELLIAEPETTLRSVCQFLELSFHPQMLEYWSRLDDFSGGESLPTHHQNLANPPTRTRTWLEEMDPRQVARFEFLAGRLLRRARYPLSKSRLTVSDLIAAAKGWGSWQGARVKKKLGLHS